MTQKTRKCIASGEIKNEDELLRFVKTSDSRLVPDFEKKLAGRGLYVSNSQSLLKKALEKNLFIKSIHVFLKIPNNMEEQVRDLLKQKGLERLAFANKAGAVAANFEKEDISALAQKVAFMIEAADGVSENCLTIKAFDENLEVLKVYDTQDLNQALGAQNTDFIAVLKSDIAAKVYQHIKRYQAFIEN